MSTHFSTLQALADTPGADLAEAALEVARLFQPDLITRPWLDRLDRHAAAVREGLDGEASALVTARALSGYLFEELGFTGNHEDFHDPRNSFLNEVLERRMGIPISLSVVYVALARRLGLAAAGVGFPSHFLVQVREEGGIRVLDAFDGGRWLSVDELNERLRRVYGEAAPTVQAKPALLRGASQREILVRMLRNLKGIYQQRGDAANALTAIEAILALEPDLIEEVGDRALVYRQLGYTTAAAEDLRRYLASTHDAREAAKLQPMLEELEQTPMRLH